MKCILNHSFNGRQITLIPAPQRRSSHHERRNGSEIRFWMTYKRRSQDTQRVCTKRKIPRITFLFLLGLFQPKRPPTLPYLPPTSNRRKANRPLAERTCLLLRLLILRQRRNNSSDGEQRRRHSSVAGGSLSTIVGGGSQRYTETTAATAGICDIQRTVALSCYLQKDLISTTRSFDLVLLLRFRQTRCNSSELPLSPDQNITELVAHL